MLSLYVVRFHEARDWICLLNPTQLTYQTLLNHWKILEQWCEQFQKAQAKGHAEFTTLSSLTYTTSSVQCITWSASDE